MSYHRFVNIEKHGIEFCTIGGFRHWGPWNVPVQLRGGTVMLHGIKTLSPFVLLTA